MYDFFNFQISLQNKNYTEKIIDLIIFLHN